MFGGDDDGLFGIFPDIDLDGDHDIMDVLILEDIMELEKQESDNYRSSYDDDDDDDDNDDNDDDDWRDNVEDGTEYLLDPDDYDTEDEYLEALEEAKYGWRDQAIEGLEFGIPAEAYETEDEYYDAVEAAQNAWKEDFKRDSRYFLDPDDYDTKDEYLEALNDAKYGWRHNAEDGSEYGLDPDDFETAEEYEDALEKAGSDAVSDTPRTAFVSASSSAASGEGSDKTVKSEAKRPNYSNIQRRKLTAKIKLENAENGKFYGSDDELERWRFIAADRSTAARYLTSDGTYLYAQAIKDHFSLPFDIPDEQEKTETLFDTLLRDLVEDNALYAIEIWEWCLDTFMPYIQYSNYKSEITHSVLLNMGCFTDEFPSHIIDHMVKKPSFINKLILQCTDSLWCIGEFVALALKGGHTETAEKIIECAFANPNTDIHDKADFIKSCIDECRDWEELETMELFKEHIFPIVFAESDVRIKNKIPYWQKDMSEYIEYIEKNCDKYAYSRVYAWRAKYRDAAVDPTRYESEEEYLRAVEERKYGWRKYCSNKFGIDPDNFETRAEYDMAISAEYTKEREARERERTSEPINMTLYKFCKVSVNYPDKPYYYYLTGGIALKTGDHVVVPFGPDNTLTDAVVMSAGECYGCAFPCQISKIKTVHELSKPDKK